MKVYHDEYHLPMKAPKPLKESIERLHIFADEDEHLVVLSFWQGVCVKKDGVKKDIEKFPLSRKTKQFIGSADIVEKKLQGIRTNLDAYFLGQVKKFQMPMNLQGTTFQMKVWEELLAVPFGQILSYKDLARKINVKTDFFRAVGSAVGKNPLCIVVPCHRVLPLKSIEQRKQKEGRASGKAEEKSLFDRKEVGNFGGGPGVKKELLNFERSSV